MLCRAPLPRLACPLLLQGVSFLPRMPLGAYAQMPYEAITEAEYRAARGRLTSLAGAEIHGQNPPAPDNFCDTDVCEVPPPR